MEASGVAGASVVKEDPKGRAPDMSSEKDTDGGESRVGGATQGINGHSSVIKKRKSPNKKSL